MEINDKIKTGLEFKEHRHFFDDYYQIRKQVFAYLAETLTDKSKFPELYKSLLVLVEYTSNYISDIEEIDAKVIEIDEFAKKKEIVNATYKVKELLRIINQKHEGSEILPQKREEDTKTQKFWRDEEHRALKEMKKAFHDIFLTDK